MMFTKTFGNDIMTAKNNVIFSFLDSTRLLAIWIHTGFGSIWLYTTLLKAKNHTAKPFISQVLKNELEYHK